MYRLSAALLLLAGCGAAAIAPRAGYRDAGAPFSSIALFDPARFAGTWYEIARYPVAAQAGCSAARSDYSPRPDGSLNVVNLCHEGGADGPLRRIEGRANVIGPGRLDVQFDDAPSLSAPYWVLWVDESYRTAVVGVPSGEAAWILNRAPVIPPDRLSAAREILDFNGFDLSRLVRVDQGR